jgi:hypothetical protein
MARLVMLIVVAPLSFHFGQKFEKNKKFEDAEKIRFVPIPFFKHFNSIPANSFL